MAQGAGPGEPARQDPVSAGATSRHPARDLRAQPEGPDACVSQNPHERSVNNRFHSLFMPVRGDIHPRSRTLDSRRPAARSGQPPTAARRLRRKAMRPSAVEDVMSVSEQRYAPMVGSDHAERRRNSSRAAYVALPGTDGARHIESNGSWPIDERSMRDLLARIERLARAAWAGGEQTSRRQLDTPAESVQCRVSRLRPGGGGHRTPDHDRLRRWEQGVVLAGVSWRRIRHRQYSLDCRPERPSGGRRSGRRCRLRGEWMVVGSGASCSMWPDPR